MESRRPQRTAYSPLTSELKRLEIRGSHWDPDRDHYGGTSHHTARYNWYKSYHSRADSSSSASQKHQHRTFRAPSDSPFSDGPLDQGTSSALRIKSRLIHLVPLPSSSTQSLCMQPAYQQGGESPVFPHWGGLSAQTSWGFSEGRKPI